MKKKYERLLEGETFITKERGNSMMPLIRSGQGHKLEPTTWDKCKVDDIVYCKVRGKIYTHLVKQVCPNRGCLIGNNKGNINGWTKIVYGKVIKVY
jgi:hypothetical protein